MPLSLQAMPMNTTRRQFLTQSAAALVAPTIVPSSVLGRNGQPSPNDQIAMACIGVGNMGTSNLRAFMQDERVRIAALADVDQGHLSRGLELAKLDPGSGVGDYREIIDRQDIDAVMIATPDHWHALITVAAARAGKDIYCEKPLAASIGEGRFVCEVVKRHRRVLQCGTWRRSSAQTRKACELVRNGYIGELKKIEVGVPGKFAIRGGFTGLEEPQSVPGHFDYGMWLGPAPQRPYTAGRCHFNFRWVLDYAPGYITDWGAHFLDVAQWGKGADDTTPVAVSATDVIYRDQGYYDAPESFRIDYTYADDVQMSMFSTTDNRRWGIKFIGTKGWIFTENTRLNTEPENLRDVQMKDDDVHLYTSANHQRNFIDCMLTRKPTAAPAETAHRAATICHLGAIAAVLKRPLRFSPSAERFKEDDDANKMLTRPMRDPWKLV
jgi:predicted dehydrogenase